MYNKKDFNDVNSDESKLKILWKLLADKDMHKGNDLLKNKTQLTGGTVCSTR